MAEITNIACRRLHPHPDNPRKELGDLTELAASIKENGIFQNLTVIPGHYLNSREYGPDEKKWSDCDYCKAAHPNCDKCCKACDEPCNAVQDCKKNEERTENDE